MTLTKQKLEKEQNNVSIPFRHTKKKLKLITDDGLQGIDAILEDNEESDEHIFSPSVHIKEERKRADLLTIDYNSDAGMRQ